MEAGPNIVATQARPHSIHTHHQKKICLSKSSQSLDPIYSSLVAGPYHENRNSMTRSSRKLKLHDKGPMRRNRHLDHLSPLLLLPPSGEEERTTQSIRTRNISGRESLLKMSLPLSEYFIFIDAKDELPWIQNFHHIWRDGLNFRFFDISNQPDSIQSHHKISSIMKLRFGLLICQLSPPIFKESLECKEVFWPRPFGLQVTPQFPEPGPTHSAPLFPLGAWRKRERRRHL